MEKEICTYCGHPAEFRIGNGYCCNGCRIAVLEKSNRDIEFHVQSGNATRFAAKQMRKRARDRFKPLQEAKE